MQNKLHYLEDSNNESLAYYFDNNNSDTTLFFFGGYNSDMTGTKATALSNFSSKIGVNYVRFDYSGHGQSSGVFKTGTISKWSEESLIFFRKFKTKQNIIIGSSMGGWIALLVALKEKQNVHGIVGIASAADFTEEEWNKLSIEEKIEFEKKGSILFPDDEYGDYEVSYVFVNDGLNNLLLKNKIELYCPVRLLHGKLDSIVPVSVSEKIIEKIESKDKTIKVIEDGEHSLSRDQDLEILYNQIQSLI